MPKKPLTPEFCLQIRPYHCELMVLYKPTLEKVVKYHRIMNFEPPNQEEYNGFSGLVLWNGSRGVLFLNLDVTNIEFGSVLAHECGHIALRVFDRIGEKNQPTSFMHEPFCYLLSNVYQRVWEACLKIDVSRNGNKST